MAPIRNGLALVLAATIGTVLAPTGSAGAQTTCPNANPRPAPQENNVYRRYHASSCWVETDDMQDYHFEASGVWNGSGGQNARRRDAYCPIINDELMSRDAENRYTQVVLSAADALSNNDDSVLVASHCVADPFSMVTFCDNQVFTATGCYGDTGDWINPGTPDPYLCVDAAFGNYTLNVPVSVHEEEDEGWYSYIGVSLSKGGTTRITGYEVSACWFGGSCPELPACS